MCDTLLCSSCSVFVIELSWTQRMDCSSVVLGLKLPSCVCLTHCGSRKIRVPGRYTSIRVSGSCIWLLHIGEDQTVCYGLHGYDNVDTSVIWRYRVYVLDVSKCQRGRSVFLRHTVCVCVDASYRRWWRSGGGDAISLKQVVMYLVF